MINIKKLILETLNEMGFFDSENELQVKVKGLEIQLKIEFPQLAYLALNSKSNQEELELGSINVKPNFRGMGIGAKVMDRIIKFADDNGLYITLKPNPQSGYKAKLLAFYKRFGFYPNTGRRGISHYGGAFGVYWIRPPNTPTRKVTEIINEYEKDQPLKFHHDCFDTHGGEIFCNLIAKDTNGSAIGYIEYSTYGDEINIKMIQTKEGERRKGIATLMAKELQRKYPKNYIQWGMTTSDGEPFVKSLKQSIGGEREITTNGGTLKYMRSGNVARIWRVNAAIPKSGFFTNALSQLKNDGIKTITINVQSSNMRNALKSLVDKGILSNPRDMIGISVDEHPSTFDILKEIRSPYKPAKNTDLRRGYIGFEYRGNIYAYDEMVPDVNQIDHSELGRPGWSNRFRYFIEKPKNTLVWNDDAYLPDKETQQLVINWLEKRGMIVDKQSSWLKEFGPST